MIVCVEHGIVCVEHGIVCVEHGIANVKVFTLYINVTGTAKIRYICTNYKFSKLVLFLVTGYDKHNL